MTTQGAIGAINGAIYQQVNSQPTGSGAIDSFVRFGDATSLGAVIQGYNTSHRASGNPKLQFDENQSPIFTRDLLLSEVPEVIIGGRKYREFLLDINQQAVDPLLSLDELRIFVSNTLVVSGSPNVSYDIGTNQLGGLTAVYDLDAGGDNWIKLNYNLNSGSGSGDMLAFIPSSLFGSATYVYLYSKFGVNEDNNDGYEEWARGFDVLTPNDGQICGLKYHDHNGNGTQDAGDETLSGWTMYLDADNDGIRDADEVSTTTGPGGTFCFTGLATGLGAFSTYRVREVVQNGWIQTTANPADIVLTSPGQSDSGSIFGNYADVSISIGLSGVNEVNSPHVFTVTVTSAAPATITAINASVSPAPTSSSSTCTTGATTTLYTCTLTINSSSAQTYTANASVTVSLGGVAVTRDTDPSTADVSGKAGSSSGAGSSPAVKHYVDASVRVDPPAATNLVGQAHTFTITVTAHNAGALINGFVITPSISPTPNLQNTHTCATPTIVGNVRTCTYTINSSQALTFTLNVTAVVTMGGVSVTRDTNPATTDIGSGPNGSGPAVKHYVSPEGDARTIGFWGNRIGERAMEAQPGGMEGALASLRALNLKDANGNDFDPTTYRQFERWLQDANAVNMVYMLSAQLAAMHLNVRSDFVSGGQQLLVVNPDHTTRCVTVANLLTEANNALANAASLSRAYLESLKNALDDGNNNLNFC